MLVQSVKRAMCECLCSFPSRNNSYKQIHIAASAVSPFTQAENLLKSKDMYNINLKFDKSSLVRSIHTSVFTNGRYGHRLVKLWEQPEYTTKPLKVFRTGGRLPVNNWKNEKVPGKVWTAKLGGGLPRSWYWVDCHRLTTEQVNAGVSFQEKVIEIIDDDNRSGKIALVAGPLKRRWILCTLGMRPGSLITNSARPQVSDTGWTPQYGDAFPLKLLPVGTLVCSLEFLPGKGAQIAKSAGNFCIIRKKVDGRVLLQMPSRREINLNENCVAVVGRISNIEHRRIKWKGATQRAEFGLRPRTGRYHKKDGRFAHRGLPPRAPVVIPDKEYLQRGGNFEE